MENKNKVVLPETVRINRFLAMSGVASRRASEELILHGEVKVNGKVVTDLSTKINPSEDSVSVLGKKISTAQNFVYLVLNKPKDYITTAKDEKDRRTVFELVRLKERVFPIGRLDRNTTGVLLFTNDGTLANTLMHPSNEIKKEYHVTLDKSLDDAHAEKLRKGIYLEDGKTSPAEIYFIPGKKKCDIIVTIHEGRNRQVRRMFEVLEYKVSQLNRLSYAGITVKGMARGKWRFLNSKEVEHLKKITQA